MDKYLTPSIANVGCWQIFRRDTSISFVIIQQPTLAMEGVKSLSMTSCYMMRGELGTGELGTATNYRLVAVPNFIPQFYPAANIFQP